MQMIESEGEVPSMSHSYVSTNFNKVSENDNSRVPRNVQKRDIGLDIILLCTSSLLNARMKVDLSNI